MPLIAPPVVPSVLSLFYKYNVFPWTWWSHVVCHGGSFSALSNLSVYAGTSLSCAGIQQWKSVSFCCWAAINLVGEMREEEQDTHPYPTHPFPSSLCEEFYILACSWWAMSSRTPTPTYPPFSFLTVWRVLHPCLLLMSNEEQDTPPPTLPTPFPSSLCEEFCMSDNMCISCLPAAVLAYWDPGGLAHLKSFEGLFLLIFQFNFSTFPICVSCNFIC